MREQTRKDRHRAWMNRGGWAQAISAKVAAPMLREVMPASHRELKLCKYSDVEIRATGPQHVLTCSVLDEYVEAGGTRRTAMKRQR